MNAATQTVTVELDRPALRLTSRDVLAANEDWGFNCGPGALCGALGLTPAEARPHLGDFEAKRYTNPMLMAAALRSLGVPFERFYQNQHQPDGALDFPQLSVARIQWDGPWCRPAVPMAARYRHTHWIAVWQPSSGPMCSPRPACCEHGECGRCESGRQIREVLDVNVVAERGAWVSWHSWKDRVAPWLTRGIDRATGRWWPTHIWSIDPADAHAAAARWARP